MSADIWIEMLKLGWRPVVEIILLTIAIYYALMFVRGTRGWPVVIGFLVLIALTFALTISYAITLRFVPRHRWLLYVQLAGDSLIVSAFIYFTGGITSYFSSLYVLPIIAGSTVQFRRGGMLVATLSAVLYSGIVLWQYFVAAGLLIQQPREAHRSAQFPRFGALVARNLYRALKVVLSFRSVGIVLPQQQLP